MKRINLTPEENEVINASDFIVVKTHELAEELCRIKNPPKSLQGKIFIIAPDGIEFLSKEDLEKALYEKS